MKKLVTAPPVSLSWVYFFHLLKHYRFTWQFGFHANVAGEILSSALPFIDRKIHPIRIISAFKRALDDAIAVLDSDDVSIPIDVNDTAAMMNLIQSTIGTKFVTRWSDLMCRLALKAVQCVAVNAGGKCEVDVKRYVRIEKVLAATLCLQCH